MQGCGDRQIGLRMLAADAAGLGLLGQFDQRARQLLDKEGHAVGSSRDLAADRGRQIVAARDGRSDRLDGGPSQAIECEARDTRMGGQDWLAVGPARQQDQNTSVFDLIEQETDELERGWIDPMHIFNDHEHRFALGERQQLFAKGGERAVALHLRRQIERTVAILVGHAEKTRDEGGSLGDRLGGRS